jgi:hypothetical protein
VNSAWNVLTKIKLILCGVDLLLWMRLGFTITHQNPTAVKTVDRSWLFSAKEGKVGSISRKGHGIGVLEY